MRKLSPISYWASLLLIIGATALLILYSFKERIDFVNKISLMQFFYTVAGISFFPTLFALLDAYRSKINNKALWMLSFLLLPVVSVLCYLMVRNNLISNGEKLLQWSARQRYRIINNR